jgi:hypothetical protein
LLLRVDAVYSGRGLRRPQTRTPLEHLAAIPEDRLPAPLRGAIRDAVLGAYSVAFGGAILSEKDVEGLRKRLA